VVEKAPARIAPRPRRQDRRLPLPRRLLTLSTFYKVLLANSAIVLVGALAGTAITAARVRDHPGANVAELMAAFVLAGIVISVAVNAVVLRAALSPLLRIERTIQAVRAGRTDARVPGGMLTDPEIERLGETLNAMLDELQRARERQTTLATQVISAQEEERRRIARELHDDTAQSLTSLLLYAKALEEGEQRPAVREALSAIREEVGRSLDGVRRLARELRPSTLDDLGLAAALDWHVQEFGRRTGLGVRFENSCSGVRLSPAIELALFRVAQEALTNVIKHAEARSATVRLICSDHLVSLCIHDDGHGFDVAGTPAGVGLYSMRERVSLIRGAFTITSSTHGTEVRAEVPRDGR
jgi:two-component system sensor histidine kinase UhpB